MKVVCAFAVLLAVAQAANFKWSSCGDNKYSTLHKLVLSPDPLTFPGTVNYEVDAELKKDVKDVSMSLKIVRNTFLLDVTLPCVKQIGSCSYAKMCSFVDDMVREDWGGIGKKIGAQIIALYNALFEQKEGKNALNNDICTTGVPAQRITKSGSIAIPELPSILSFIAEGDYTVRMEMKDNSDNTQLACLELNAELEDKSASIWGKRKRRLGLVL